ncbi:hypothetical protein P7C70_g7637, partial [Phenoliferia sp. Uapishka_3]
MESLGFPSQGVPDLPLQTQTQTWATFGDAPRLLVDVPESKHSDFDKSSASDGDESVEMSRALSDENATSLSDFQLPNTGRESVVFGKNMLWEALGLSPDEELDYSSGYNDHAELSPSLDSSTTESMSTHRSTSSMPERSQSSVSTLEEISDDIFNLSEFPAFNDLPSFSSSDAAPDDARDEDAPHATEVDASGSKRASAVLVFPSPPTSSPPATPSTLLPTSLTRPKRADSLVPEGSTDVSRANSPSFNYGRESPTDEAGHEAAHDRLAALVLANLGLGSDPGLAGVGLGLSASKADLGSQPPSRSSSSLGRVRPELRIKPAPFALEIDESKSQLAYAASESHTSEDEPVGATLTTTAFFPIEVEQRSRSSPSPQPFPFDTRAAITPTRGLAEHSSSAHILRKQSSIPAIFRVPSTSTTVESPTSSSFQPSDFSHDPRAVPPRAYAMELGSPLTLNFPPSFSGAFALDPNIESGARSPSAASYTSSLQDPYQSRSRANSNTRSGGSASPKTPKSPAELYGASLSRLPMSDDSDFPMWGQYPGPASRSSSPTPSPRHTPREAPSPLPRTLRASASAKSLREDAPRSLASRRMSFSSLKRRKSDVALAETAKGGKDIVPPTPALPRAPALTPLPLPIKSSPLAAAPEDPAVHKMKRKSRLSLFIPRFGKKDAVVAVAVPTVPIRSEALSPALSVESSFSSSHATTPALTASHDGSLLADSTFPTTPTTLPQSPAPSSFFVDRSESKETVEETLKPTTGHVFIGADNAVAGMSPASVHALPLRQNLTASPVLLHQPLIAPVRSSSIFPRHDLSDALQPPPAATHSFDNDFDASAEYLPLPLTSSLPSPATSPLVPSQPENETEYDAESLRSAGTQASQAGLEEESDSDEDMGLEVADDDVPLGTMPGALKMQKSLRLTARKPKTAAQAEASATRAQRRLPKKDLTIVVKPDPLPPIIASALSPTPPTSRLPPAHNVPTRANTMLAGHSLLPHTDAAVIRRGATDFQCPSPPLTPIVAQSSLTMDAPTRPKPTKSSTLDVLPSFTRKRPPLVVNTTTGRRASHDSSPPPRSPLSPTQAATPRPLHCPHPLSSSQRVPVPAVQPTAPVMERNATSQTSATSSKASPPRGANTEHRVFINNHTTHIMVTVSSTTRCGEVVAGAKARGALVGGTDAEGGWALFEICRNMGLGRPLNPFSDPLNLAKPRFPVAERPIREYEILDDVVKSWHQEANILIIRRTTLWPVLSSHLRPQPSQPRSDWVQFETKKGKWSKRFLTLKDAGLSHSKSDKGKDPTQICQLTAFDVFFVAQHVIDRLKAPKPFVFALKSLLPRVHYEKEEEYCYFVSVKTAEELHSWMKSITEARNSIVRAREATVLGKPGQASPSASTAPSAPLVDLPRSQPSRSVPSRPPPPSLTLPTLSPNLPSGKLNSPSQGVLTNRPNAQAWSNMSELERHKWLKEAEREARVNKASFLEFGEDESKASRASDLIKRFQAQISSDETPLVPSSSFASAGRPRPAPPGPAPLAARLEDTRKSLEGYRKVDHVPLKSLTVPSEQVSTRPWLKSANSSESVAKSAQSTTEESAPPLQPVVTRPSLDVVIPAAVPSSTLSAEGTPVIASGLSAKEGLSRPSSPLFETGRLSVPPPSDENSPPPSPIYGSPPPLAFSPTPASTSSLTSSPPVPSSPAPSLHLEAAPRKVTRSGSITEPTQAFLLKTKPRVSSGHTPSSTSSRSASPTGSTRSRGLSHPASPTPPSSVRMSPTNSRSSLGARLSPSEEKPRSHSSASNRSTVTSTGGGAGPRKVVPTTGTPRSRAAAAAATAESSTSNQPGPSTPNKKLVASAKVPLTPKTPVARLGASSTPTRPKTTTTPAKPTTSRSPALGSAVRGTSSSRGQSTPSRGRGGVSAAAPATPRRRSSPSTTPAVPPTMPRVGADDAGGEEEEQQNPHLGAAIEGTASAQSLAAADMPSYRDERGESHETPVSTTADGILDGEEEQADCLHPHSIDLSESVNATDIRSEGEEEDAMNDVEKAFVGDDVKVSELQHSETGLSR